MIAATGLTKRYGTTAAVDGLTFEVKPGIVTGFLGPNGAGKTTSMRLILGLDKATEGTVTINGGGADRPDAPWPGAGDSGVGIDRGMEGFREFFHVRHVQFPLASVGR